ncbi:ferredoxin-NADP+ reductase [Raphidocelis subcapitata]|uniref:ferredoxin--NADP(+) reductase n=1 Tax=Raphidocelis subcapitata TaxID=307507 RepID=A0A2V0NQK8_9CHLO|nr:ferredoxin-NADP+ reductase [Raphidocelis subcapitata]|eukprot:GBF87830.1 ferredoxin-NADP+ reductase [Raphidocelis subcapitata]
MQIHPPMPCVGRGLASRVLRAAPAGAATARPPRHARALAATATSDLRQPVSVDWEHLRGDQVPLNLYGGKKEPFVGRVVAIRDMGGRDRERHVSHIVIDTGGVPFVEGQAFGVIPPGSKLNSKGKEVAHGVRLYSIASSRYGDGGDGKTCTLCVVRVIYKDASGNEVRGLCSNYLCDRAVGDELAMTGPSGTAMLLPDDHMARDVICVSTGTGIAPFRSFWRRLFYDGVPGGKGYGGRFRLYSGFANQDSVLYGEELEEMAAAYPGSFRLAMALSLERRNQKGGQEYVQDKIEEDAEAFLAAMGDGSTQFYFCGLKRMYSSVTEVLERMGKEHGVDAPALIAKLKKEHRWHVETA